MINQAINDYYENMIEEQKRLDSNYTLVELERTKEIITRYIEDKAQLKILDLGAACGRYSFWLSSFGHDVTMVEPIAKHIKIAKEINRTSKNKITIIHDNALNIDFEENTYDLVLNFGPIYHLIESEDRILMHNRIKKILKPNGIYFISFISRFATLLDGYRKGIMHDKEYVNIVKQDLKNGQHRGSKDKKRYFTDAYFYLPEEMRDELKNLDFNNIELFALQSFSWILGSLEKILENKKEKQQLYNMIKLVEKESSMLGVSPHILAKCNK